MKKRLLTLLVISFLFSCKKDEKSETPSNVLPETVTDVDGNIYHAVKIGNQVWMVENLKVTHYNTGNTVSDLIPLIEDAAAWKNLGTPGFCWYDNNKNANGAYGALYNWYAASSDKLAPTGWRVATGADWYILKEYLTNNNYKVAKSLASKSGWQVSANADSPGNDASSNNQFGFNAMPGGSRTIPQLDPQFSYMGQNSPFWTSTEINGKGTQYNINFSVSDLTGSQIDKRTGCYIRCIKQ
jgi:uncharacterized protein (TIGR02145 family)